MAERLCSQAGVTEEGVVYIVIVKNTVGLKVTGQGEEEPLDLIRQGKEGSRDHVM